MPSIKRGRDARAPRDTTTFLNPHTNILRLREEVQRLEPALPAHPALLHAAEGDAEVAEQPAVDPDRAGVEGRGHPVRAGEVACPDGGGEAIAGGVGEGDGFAFIVSRSD